MVDRTYEKEYRIHVVKDALVKALEKTKVADKERLAANIMANWGVNRRTALEYIAIVIAQLKLIEEDDLLVKIK